MSQFDIRSPIAKAQSLLGLGVVLALAQKDLHRRGALRIADEVAAPEVREVIRKGAVDPGTTTDSDYASSLSYRTLSDSFVTSLRPISSFDSIRPHSVQTPPDVWIAVASSTSVGSVVDQGAPKPVRAQQWGLAAPTMQRVVWLGVVNDEVLKSPFADRALAAEARVGVALGGDVAVLTALALAAPSAAATGTTLAAFKADMANAVSALRLGAGSRVIAILAPSLLAQIAFTFAEAFPELRIDGGEAAGVLFVPSDAVEVETAGSDITLVDAAQCVTADAGVTVRTSQNASVQMSDDPDDPGTSSTVMMSTFQHNRTAILVERLIGFAKARSTAAAVITGANYGG